MTNRELGAVIQRRIGRVLRLASRTRLTSRGLRLGVKHALRASALAGIVVVDNYAFECLESCRAVS